MHVGGSFPESVIEHQLRLFQGNSIPWVDGHISENVFPRNPSLFSVSSTQGARKCRI
jgi:hypothetical protein